MVPRTVTLTLLTPPAGGPIRASFQLGTEPSVFDIADVQLRRGCSEVMVRVFEHGIALANGSRQDPAVFDLEALAGDRRYRRFSGRQAPLVNNGRPVGGTVTIPPVDGLLLETIDSPAF